MKGLEGADQWESLEAGELVWDDDFDVSKKENQDALLEFCDYLDTFYEEDEENHENVSCWIRDYHKILTQKIAGSDLLVEDDYEELFTEDLYKFATEEESGKLAVR